jgi:anti-anti-sigma regulatory factor
VPRQRDDDDSTDGNIPPLIVLLSVIRPAVPLLQARGELISATVDTLLDHLDRELCSGAKAIVLDLSELSVLGVDAVPALADVAYRAGEADVGLYVVGTDVVEISLRIAGNLELFDVYCDVANAMAAIPCAPRHPGR